MQIESWSVVSWSLAAGNPKFKEIDFIGTPFSFQETDCLFDSKAWLANESRFPCFPEEYLESLSSWLMSKEQNLNLEVWEKWLGDLDVSNNCYI